MRNKKILFISILLFMVVLSIGAISAEDVDDAIVSDGNTTVAESQSVSGNVGVFVTNPWNTTGELSFDIPSDAISIKSADVYVNVYGGSAKNTYGANANITITAGDNYVQYNELLWTEEGSSDGTVYTVNGHTTKCYSDYMIHYDITSLLDGLSGSVLNIDVSTFEMDNKTFDGRIKLIALVFAYDDGDDDVINYWINDDQLWSKTNVTVTFDTEDIAEFTEACLANVVLSSGDGTYVLNDEFLGDTDYHESGDYFQFNAWDVTEVIKANQKTDLDVLYAGTSAYGSIKNALSVLVIMKRGNTVSGGVDFAPINPWNTTGELCYVIPSNATRIKSADVYVNVYGGSAKNTYGANANITITAGDNSVQYNELLWTEEGSSDGTVYTVNGHTTKCYSDYMIHYDITSLVSGLNGTELIINVSTFEMYNKSFDGRIKLIALVVAYDDGDDDVINYWINDDQLWSKTNVTVTFDTENVTEFTEAYLANVVLSSGDGTYVLNDEFLGDADVHETGDYYQFNGWDVTEVVKANQKTDLDVLYAGTSAYGSIKNVLSILVIGNIADQENTVSGGVDVVTVNPWNTTGALIYDIPSNATAIRHAGVYVNVYGGSAKNTYGANANITFTAGDNSVQYNELLWTEEGSSDGTVYLVNDHTTKCYSDYMIYYDITDFLDGLNGAELIIDVSTFEMYNKSFDGRIKLIALVLAYDDGDDDFIGYWINDDQLWSKTNVTITFDTEDILWLTEADLYNVVLSSADGTYVLNDEVLGDSDVHESGDYYQFNAWDVTDLIEPTQKTDLNVLYAGSSAYGSIKNVLSVLVIRNEIIPDNTVSGGVDVVTENPWNTTGELSYYIPSDAGIEIRHADVYVNVYGGSAKNTYGANANITITAGDTIAQYSELLWTEEGSSDGTVYTVNDHTTKCYSDYMIHYDITDLLDGFNGTELNIDVSTFKMDNKTFDGRIKLIALVVAYDDDDEDVIGYWINDDQLWSKTNVTVTFDTDDVTLFSEATLRNVVLSSGDGTYALNDEFLGDAYYHESGNYYQYNAWNVTDFIEPTQKTDLDVICTGTGTYASIKNVLSVLTVNYYIPEISIAPEYIKVPTAYAGTNNTLTVNVTTTKAGNFSIKLYADGIVVDEGDVTLVEGKNTILLTDPTIRDVDASTVNGAENNMVTYAAELSYNGVVVVDTDVSLPVLYNGNLASEYEFNVTGFEDFASYDITGDFVIDVKDSSSYLGSSAMGRTDDWTVTLDSNSEITNAFVYVPYNWFNNNLYTEDADMFNVTFNSVSLTPVAWYRDQSNLGGYGRYGYGVLIYDVSDLIANGENSFVLNKVNPTPAVYPSVLIYMYNTTGSTVSKTVNILNGADLLSNSDNLAGRTVESNTEIVVDTDKIDDATLYVLAGGAQAGESDIIFNGEFYSNVWSGSSSTTDLFVADVTDLVSHCNFISFVATGSTILELPQIIVTSKNILIDTSLSASYDANTMELIATLTNNVTGQPIKGANVRFVIDGAKYTVKTNSNGQAPLSTAGLAPDTYPVTVSYNGNSKYAPSSTTVDVVVKSPVYLVVEDVFAEYGDTVELSATLINNETGKVITGANVRFTVDGQKYTVKTNSKGEAKLNISGLAVDTYTATVSYNGNSKYNPTTTTADIVVTKISTSISAVYNAEANEFVATLINTLSGKGISGANVVVNINGVKTSIKTDKQGQIKFAVDNVDLSTFNAGFSYGGNSKYLKSSTTIKVVENKTTTSLSTIYDDETGEVVATLTNTATGKAVTGANVVINVNGVKTAVKTDRNGQAKLPVEDLDSGVYSVGSSYGGNSKYAGSSTSMNMVKI